MPRLYVTGKAIAAFKEGYEVWEPMDGEPKNYSNYLLWLLRAEEQYMDSWA
jgi:hypothetical protein